MDYQAPPPDRRLGIGPLVPGLLLTGAGALFLLNNLGILRMQDFWRYWRAILVAAGTSRLVDSIHHRRRIEGVFLTVLGRLLLACNLHFFDVRFRDLWPLGLIAPGLWLLAGRLGSGVPTPTGASSDTVIEDWVLFGGGKRKVTTQNFEGGRISTVFGGVEIDLRRAQMRIARLPTRPRQP
jgi:hypothetical protein